MGGLSSINEVNGAVEFYTPPDASHDTAAYRHNVLAAKINVYFVNVRVLVVAPDIITGPILKM